MTRGRQRRLGQQGLLPGPRRRQGRRRRHHQEGLPQARAGAPPRLQARRQGRGGALQAGRRGLRRRRRRREAQGVRPDALHVRRRLPGRRQGRVRLPGRLRRLLDGLGRRGWVRHLRPVRQPVRRWWQPAWRRCAARRPRRRSRDRGHDRLQRRGRGHDRGAADVLRRRVRDLQGHRGQAGDDPARLPDLRRRRHGDQHHGRRLLDERDLPGVPRPPADLRRALPDLPRLRSWPVQPDAPGADPGRGEGRPADPAQGQGCPRRERRPGRRPVRHRARPAPPPVRPQGRQPDADRAGHLRRGCARCRDQGADARRWPGDAADPGRHPERTGVPGAGPRRCPQGRHQGRPARHRRGAGAVAARRRRSGSGHGVPRSDGRR